MDPMESTTKPAHTKESNKVFVPNFKDVYPFCFGIDNVVLTSTEKNVKSVWKLWYEFCALPSIDHSYLAEDLGSGKVLGYGIGLYANAESRHEFLGERPPSESSYDKALVAQFMNWLTDVKKASANQVQICSLFLNSHLKGEFYSRMVANGLDNPTYPTVKVGTDRQVANCRARAKQNPTMTQQKACGNILSAVSDTISSLKFRELLEFVMCSQDALSGLHQMKTVMLLQFVAQFTLLAQICRRGEDLYNQLFHHRFIKVIDALGPIGGTVCSWVLLNSGKVNKCNRNEWTCHAPHVDPLRDATGWLGNLWLYRYFFSREPLPDFDNWDELSTLPTFRKYLKTEKQTSQGFYDIWKSVYTACRLNIKKVTHHWKGQGVRDMTNALIPPLDVALFTGTQSQQIQVTQSLLDSYMYDAPIRCVVQRAGGDSHDPRLHAPAYSRVDVSDELLLCLPGMAELLTVRDRLMRQDVTVISRKERDENRIETRLLCLQAFIHDIKRALQVSAARPVDPENSLTQQQEPSIQKTPRYRNGLLSDVFSLEIFKSKEYKDLCDRVRDAEDAALSTFTKLKSDNEFSNAVVQELRATRMQMYEVQNEVKAQKREVVGGWNSQVDVHVRLPVPVPTVAMVTHTKAGTLRVRSLGTRSEHVRLAETPTDVPRPPLLDSHCRSMEDHWRLFNDHWLPLETKYGDNWRKDWKVQRKDGTWHKSEKNRRWWSCRTPLYGFIKEKIAGGLSESAAIEAAQDVYNSLEVKSRTNKPAIQELSAAFIKIMGGRPIGRPGTSMSKACKKAQQKESGPIAAATSYIAAPTTHNIAAPTTHNVAAPTSHNVAAPTSHIALQHPPYNSNVALVHHQSGPPLAHYQMHFPSQFGMNSAHGPYLYDAVGAPLTHYQIHSPYGMHASPGSFHRYPVPIAHGPGPFYRTSPPQYGTSSPNVPGAYLGGDAPGNVHRHPY
jgi:hypothetical protein